MRVGVFNIGGRRFVFYTLGAEGWPAAFRECLEMRIVTFKSLKAVSLCLPCARLSG